MPKTQTPAPQTPIVPTTPAPRATTHSSFTAAAGAMREQTPFGAALGAARRIASARPHQDQPAELADLKSALSKLDESGTSGLFWLLVREVVVDGAPVQPMFAVARYIGTIGAAYNAAAIANARRSGPLTLEETISVGLVEIKFHEVNGREIPRLQPMVGQERLVAAASKLRQAGKIAAADVLDKHIRDSEKSRLLGQAARERAQGKLVAPATPAATPTHPDA